MKAAIRTTYGGPSVFCSFSNHQHRHLDIAHLAAFPRRRAKS